MRTAVMASEAASSVRKEAAQGPFRRIICGVDGSPPSNEAVRQAGALASAGTAIELVAVTDARTRTAGEALRHAHAALRDSAADVIRHHVSGRAPWRALLEASESADLLVVGRHPRSRFSGVFLGTTAATVLHKAEVPVLLAVKPPMGADFPGRILVGADGPGRPQDAVRVAGRIAAHSGSEIVLLRVDWSHRAQRPQIAAAIAELTKVGATAAVEIVVGGTPHRLIPEYAEREQASLVITGGRDLTSLRALDSISERVAHKSPCSVLVLRGRR